MLYIDSNEPKDIQITVETTVKNRQNDIQVNTKGLKTGDFVYNDVVIERKEASDLASSIKDGRLKEQTLRMSEDFQHQYIIVEGNPYQLEYSSLHDNAFIGTMVSRSYAGIPIIHTPDKEGTAYAVNKIIEKHGEGEERTLELEKTSVESEDITVAMLGCIRGISKEKAEEITNMVEFNTLAAMLSYIEQCGEAEFQNRLQDIEGIGPKLAGRILTSLRFGEEDMET